MISSKPTIAIIGAGNMGSALAGGLIANNYPANHIWLTDPSAEKLKHIAQTLKVQVTQQNEQAIQLAKVVILAVKPQVMANVATALAPEIQIYKPLILSIAAGIPLVSLQKWLGKESAIVRAMPNTPALIRCGASGLFANSEATQEQRQMAESIMQAVGMTVWLNTESELDIVTALSGSGPAYFFLIIEALQEAAKELGLSAEVARLLALQTAYGASRMAQESSQTVKELRQQVTSPGGTTERAIQVFEEGHLRELFKKALRAAKERSEELAHQA